MYKNHSQDKYTGVGLLGGELYWPLTSPNQNMNGVHKDKSKVGLFGGGNFISA